MDIDQHLRYPAVVLGMFCIGLSRCRERLGRHQRATSWELPSNALGTQRIWTGRRSPWPPEKEPQCMPHTFVFWGLQHGPNPWSWLSSSMTEVRPSDPPAQQKAETRPRQLGSPRSLEREPLCYDGKGRLLPQQRPASRWSHPSERAAARDAAFSASSGRRPLFGS